MVGLSLVALVGLGCATRPPRSQAPGPQAHVLPDVPLREFPDDHCGPGSLSVVLNALGDPVTMDELRDSLPRAPGGGVLSVDMLLAARQRGFDAHLVRGTEAMIRREVGEGRPVILLLKLLNAPGRDHDVYHYVVVDGLDPESELLRFQFGDGQARWSGLTPLEDAWEGAGHALLSIRKDGPRTPGLAEAVGLEKAGHLAEAGAAYERILRERPDSIRAWVNLGNVRMAEGKGLEAEDAFRRALDLAPGDPDALNNLAWLLFLEGTDLEEAEALARSALPVAGGDRTLVLDTLARIQAARGRCGDADATLADALEAPDLEEARRHDLERARDDIGKACSHDGGTPSPPPGG